jgi:hypothetical protein
MGAVTLYKSEQIRRAFPYFLQYTCTCMSVSLHVHFSWLFASWAHVKVCIQEIHPDVFLHTCSVSNNVEVADGTYWTLLSCVTNPFVTVSVALLHFCINLYMSHKVRFSKRNFYNSGAWYSDRYSAWATGWAIRCASTGRGKIFFFSPECPDRSWAPGSLLFNAYLGSFQVVERSGF